MPTVNEVCAAQYSLDNGWYRAQVNRILNDGTIHLTFVDYGNEEEVEETKVRLLTPAFKKLAILVGVIYMYYEKKIKKT